MKYPEITLTMTTSKRYNLFECTIKSFFDNCQDVNLISEIIICDDNSNNVDIQRMQDLLKDYKYDIQIIHKQKEGHAVSLNLLFGMVKTEYIIHIEDDWEFILKGNYIKNAIDIMNNDKKIKSVILRNWIAQGMKRNKLKTINDIKYYEHEYSGKPFILGELETYPGYSLNPSIQNMADIRKNIGKFKDVKMFEYNFALRYYNIGAGYKIAFNEKDYCKHIGNNINAYKLNNTNP